MANDERRTTSDERKAKADEPPASPAELLIQAAEALERKRAPRANKFYRAIAADVRRLAARVEE